MIKQKTVVVVGAGASNDLGLPIGSGLQERICQVLSTDNELRRYFRSALYHFLGKKNKERAELAFSTTCKHSAQIRSAASIDNFLDQHRDNADLVAFLKMLIAFTIAEAEKNSNISRKVSDERKIMDNQDYFLYDLMNISVRGHQADNLSSSLKNITFIIYNYDRCVERYLDTWLRFRFGPNFEWRENGPKFIHVYGSLGDYFDPDVHNPFEHPGDGPFLNPHFELPSYVERIKVFTEQEDSLVRQDIANSVHQANALIFLGFGFEEQNMRFFDTPGENKKVFATLYGMSPENRDHLKEDLAARFSSVGRWVQSVDGKAKKLMADCYFPLTKAVGSI